MSEEAAGCDDPGPAENSSTCMPHTTGKKPLLKRPQPSHTSPSIAAVVTPVGAGPISLSTAPVRSLPGEAYRSPPAESLALATMKLMACAARPAQPAATCALSHRRFTRNGDLGNLKTGEWRAFDRAILAWRSAACGNAA